MTLSPRGTIMALFVLQAMSFGGWFSRVGDIQLGLGIGQDTLGLAMMGMVVGALLTFPFGPPSVERFGPRPLVLAAIPLTAIGCALSTLATDAWQLFFTLIVVGVGHGFATMAINVEADRVEALTGRRVMNTCHGVWSLGFVVAALSGVAARSLATAPSLHMTAIAVVVAAGTFVIALPMRGAPSRQLARTAPRRLVATPTTPIWVLIGFIQASSFLENGAFAWSVIYFRDTFDAPVWLETLTLPVFLLASAVGRLCTDGWVERYGPRRVAVVLSAVAFVGALPLAWSGSEWLSLAGFALIGFGMSCAFPLSISAAARIGDRPASENVAAFSVIQRTLSLLVPVLIGIAAANWGIAAAFAAMLPLPLIAMALAGSLEQPKPRG
jgi:MFS family permease